jgi:hypothetical protein
LATPEFPNLGIDEVTACYFLSALKNVLVLDAVQQPSPKSPTLQEGNLTRISSKTKPQ